MLRDAFEQLSSTLDVSSPPSSDLHLLRAENLSERRCLSKDVLNALLASAHPALRHIEVTADGSHISLGGWVPTYYLKQCAQVAALKVEGVRSVHNVLSVPARRSFRRW